MISGLFTVISTQHVAVNPCIFQVLKGSYSFPENNKAQIFLLQLFFLFEMATLAMEEIELQLDGIW